MLHSTSKKTVVSGFMLALGILLPFMASHGLSLFPGNVFLPMHLPVLLCGFFCGPKYGALCGLILPILNSSITGMPVLFPNAVIMTCELFTYGLLTGLFYKLFGYSDKLRHIYLSLIGAMLGGRIIYGIAASLLLLFNPSLGKLSVIAAVIQGIPGILIQLVVVPYLVFAVRKNGSKKQSSQQDAITMVKNGKASFVIVKNNHIVSAESPRGIDYVLKMQEEGALKNTFIADKIIGKAAAMIFTYAGVNSCYGETISNEAIKWLQEHNISVTYGTCVESIQNRTGDGICPMEQTVLNINDEAEAIILLKNKVAELSAKQKQ